MTNQRFLFISAGIFCMTSVMLGAFGAHGLKPLLSEGSLHSFDTASKYQFFHGLALAVFALVPADKQSKLLRIAGFFVFTGIILFSGSLYLLSTAAINGLGDITWLGPVTPLGGLCFTAGWALFTFNFIKR